jgi:protein arginine N-methyltransferase 1
MTTPTSYRIHYYGEMITDEPRMQAYVEALTRSVFPGCVVLDIGAGTGIFSMLACQLGAGQVHTVEPDNSIHVAGEIAAANGFSDGITFHQSISTKIDIPKRADIIISDLRGILPLLQHHIPSIIDARERLLAPGGCLIPQSDDLYAALVESPELYRLYEEPWRRNNYDLDMRAGRKSVTSSWRKVNLKNEHLLTKPEHVATIDYNTIESPDLNSRLLWTIEHEGTCHGLAIWFDATLCEGIGFTNAPGQPELIYGQAFFPLKEEVKLEAGDVICINISAKLIDHDYIWSWSTNVYTYGNTNKIKVAFKQSSFFAIPFSLESLRKQEATYVPSLDKMGEVDLFLLSLMNGSNRLEEIAHLAIERFPDHFKN